MNNNIPQKSPWREFVNAFRFGYQIIKARYNKNISPDSMNLSNLTYVEKGGNTLPLLSEDAYVSANA